MREPPHIIKAINALRRFASFSFEDIDRIPYIREEMADHLITLGYAQRRISERDGITAQFKITDVGRAALDAPAEKTRPRLKTLEPRLKPMPSRLKLSK